MCAAVEASDWDDGDEPRPDPYLPPEERWWRHPSELGGPAQPLPVARPALLTAPSGGRVALALAVAIGAAGAVLAAYVAHLAQPATDEVATTVVRVTAATTAPVVTVASTVPPSAVPGVVQLVMPSGSSKRNGTAAAVTDGQLVTSAQMVAGMTQVTAVMPDGSEQQATVVMVDSASGTAVLEIAQPTPTLASGQAATLGPGDPVTAAGTNTSGQVEAVGVEATASDGTDDAAPAEAAHGRARGRRHRPARRRRSGGRDLHRRASTTTPRRSSPPRSSWPRPRPATAAPTACAACRGSA